MFHSLSLIPCGFQVFDKNISKDNIMHNITQNLCHCVVTFAKSNLVELTVKQNLSTLDCAT